MTDYIGPLAGELDRYTKLVRQKVCPICGERRWLSPLLAIQPLAHGQESDVDADAPLIKNNWLISAVFRCQACRYELRFGAAVMPIAHPIPPESIL